MTGKKEHYGSSTGSCVYCRRAKQTFRSRKAARRHIRQVHPGQHMTAYLCKAAPEGIEVWHYGHDNRWREEAPCDEDGVAYVAPKVHATPGSVVSAIHALAQTTRKEPT